MTDSFFPDTVLHETPPPPPQKTITRWLLQRMHWCLQYANDLYRAAVAFCIACVIWMIHIWLPSIIAFLITVVFLYNLRYVHVHIESRNCKQD